MKKYKIIIIAILTQLIFISSVQASCDLNPSLFGISYNTLMSKLKLDAEFMQSEEKGAAKQILFAPGEVVCKNEKIFEDVPVDFIFLYDKLVEIQVMRFSESLVLIDWLESVYGENANKPNSLYFQQPNAQLYWESSNAVIAYSAEYFSNEVMESFIIQSLNHQKDFERFNKELKDL